MKIVIGTDVFYPRFETGGAIHTFNVARWLVKFGHDVTVLCGKTSSYSNELDPSLPDYEEVEGIKIIRSKRLYKYGASVSSLPSLFEIYLKLRSMIKNKEVDIVNAVGHRFCLPLVAAAKGKVPCIATVHAISLQGGFLGFNGWKNYEPGKLPAMAGCLLENVILRLPYDGLMAVSDYLVKELLKYYPNTRIKIIYGGVDLQEIDKVASGPKKHDQIVFLGLVDRRKNILDVIEATKLARNEIRDLKLVVISSGGEYEKMIEKICKEDEFFKYYKKPSREQIFKILKESSLLVHPSEKETFSLAIAESLACNTPFIAYDVPSMREALKRFSGGVLVSYKDRKALSQKICELLNDKDKVEKLARWGRDAVESKFTWEKTAKRVEEALEVFLKVSAR